MVTNSYSFKLNILVTLVTDIILLVFMLVGLLRVRLHDGGTLKLGPFLWKQVGGKTLHGPNPFNSLMTFSLGRASFGSYSPLLLRYLQR
jgi:hypothetical protein